MSMYRIQKNIYKAKKPLWIQCLLFNIMPNLYDPHPSKEECQKNLKAISSAINCQKYYWHQHHSMIGKFCKLVICDDYIKIMSKKGNLMLSFVIERCEDDELNVN